MHRASREVSRNRILPGGAATLALAKAAHAEIRIPHVHGKTGPPDARAEQSRVGLVPGVEYAADGTTEIDGEPVTVIGKETRLDPARGRALLAEAWGDDDAHIVVGPVRPGVALAILPVAEEYERILLVEPAVADSITGANRNRYIFRTGRNSSQDAVSNAIALAGPDVKIATLAQDYAFGRDGIAAAFREALEETPAEIVHENSVPTDTTDFTAAAERVFDAMADVAGDKTRFIVWAGGGNPMGKIRAMAPLRASGSRSRRAAPSLPRRRSTSSSRAWRGRPATTTRSRTTR